MLKEETCKNFGHKFVQNFRTSILHCTVQYNQRKTALAKKRKDASKTIVDNKKIAIYKLYEKFIQEKTKLQNLVLYM